MACLLATTCAASIVYENDFEDAPGQEWSQRRRSITPLDGREYLGDFANTNLTLTLTNFSAHTNLVLEFDLYLLRSWDGNGDCCAG